MNKSPQLLYEDAKYLWSDGHIMFKNGEPRLGDHFPSDVIPFWCQWLKKDHIQFQKIWSRIESDDFWRDAFRLVKHNEKMELLQMAGQFGNLSVFRNMDVQAVSDYANTVTATTSRWYHIIHPVVLQWMHSKKYWNDCDLVELMDVYACKGKGFPSALEIYGLCEEHSPTDDFLENWYVSLFRDFNFSPTLKANIAGSFFQTKRSDIWQEYVCAACTPYLEGIDLPLLYLAFGEALPHTTEELGHLYKSVQLIASSQVNSSSDIEPILRIAMDLQPIECSMDLYYRACYAKEQILNLDKNEAQDSTFAFEMSC